MKSKGFWIFVFVVVDLAWNDPRHSFKGVSEVSGNHSTFNIKNI